MTGMPKKKDWPRLGLVVAARRNELGLTQEQAAARGGTVSLATWRKLESGGYSNFSQRVLAGVCRALRWTPDSIDQVLAGRDPPRIVAVDDAAGSVTLIYKIRASDNCEFCSDSGETDDLTIGAQTSYGAHRAMFLNPRVQTSTVTMQARYIDSFGKSMDEVELTSTLTRPTVDAHVDWKGLAHVVLNDNKTIYCISDSRFVRTNIYAKLEDPGCLAAVPLVP